MGKGPDSSIKTKINKKDKNIKIIKGAVLKKKSVKGPNHNMKYDNQNFNFRRNNNAYSLRTSTKKNYINITISGFQENHNIYQ